MDIHDDSMLARAAQLISTTMKPAASNAATPAHGSPSSPSPQELSTFMPLVQQLVNGLLRKLPPNVLRDDLIAAGTFGLLDALRKSADRGPAFVWYARIRIRGAVVDELRSQDWLSRRARTRAARAQAEGHGGATTAVVGFDDLPEGQKLGFVDRSAAMPDEQVELRMNRVALEHAVALLPEREARIVSWHYFEGIPFRTIAARLGVSEPRISQLHSRAMQRLREALRRSEAA